MDSTPMSETNGGKVTPSGLRSDDAVLDPDEPPAPVEPLAEPV